MIDHTVTEVRRPPELEPPPAKTRSRRRWVVVGIVVVLLLGAVYLARSKRSTTTRTARTPLAAQKGTAIPVVAAKAERGSINVEIAALGSVTPIYTVTVRSRVDGELTRVLYTEGQTVRRGELLAQIDPRPFQVQLLQAQGQLAKDQASLSNARIDLQRYQQLVPHNAVPEQQVATQAALVKQFEGAVKTDEGQIASAKLNLVYSRITAPVTGRVGLRLVDPGNIVHATDQNGLLVITEIQPISVIFTIAEDQVPAVVSKMGKQPLSVSAFRRDNQTKLADGLLASLDNQIDPTTGTLRLRANFNNRDNTLFPNQFVNVRLLVERKQGVTKLPTAAIQRGSNNTYVYVVKPDSTVTMRPVTVGASDAGESEISSGLSPGETVVMTGVDKLQDGSKVVVHFAGDNSAGQGE